MLRLPVSILQQPPTPGHRRPISAGRREWVLLLSLSVARGISEQGKLTQIKQFYFKTSGNTILPQMSGPRRPISAGEYDLMLLASPLVTKAMQVRGILDHFLTEPTSGNTTLTPIPGRISLRSRQCERTPSASPSGARATSGQGMMAVPSGNTR